MWEPYTSLNINIAPVNAKGEKLAVTYNAENIPQTKVRGGEKISFKMDQISDMDRFSEYLQDKEDASRLPKNVKEESEKDLVSITWSSGSGGFTDEKQSQDKAWQAPKQAGSYKVSVMVDDLGLVRHPDKGIRKDSASELSMIAVVE